MGHGHQLHPHGAWLRLSGRGDRLVQPSRFGLEAVDHDGHILLSGGAGRSPGQVWQAGDLQHGSGSQFTSEAFTGRLKEAGIAISMDGKGRWCDNVFVERFWKSIKYEHVYLHAYESVQEARTKIGRYIDFFNTTRPHSSLNALTPDQVYFHRPPEALAA